MKWIARAALAGACLVTVAGCGSGDSYSSMLDLRDAAVEAGLSCPNWNRTDSNEPGEERAECSRESVLLLYDDPEQAKAGAEKLASGLREYGLEVTLAVGDNWVINSPDGVDLAERMGVAAVTE